MGLEKECLAQVVKTLLKVDVSKAARDLPQQLTKNKSSYPRLLSQKEMSF